MKKVIGVFSIVEEAEKALRNIQASGFKPLDIKLYSKEEFHAVDRNIGYPVTYIPVASNSFSSSIGSIWPAAAMFSDENEMGDLSNEYYGKATVEISCSEDETSTLGTMLRNNGAKDVKTI